MIHRKYFDEFFSSLILGGIPCLYIFGKAGEEALVVYLRAIDTSSFTLRYFALLAGIHFFLSLVGHFAPRFIVRIKTICHFFYPIINGVGSSLLCLYRALTGFIIACCFIGLTYFPVIGEVKYSVIFLLYAFPFIWVCAFLNQAFEYAVSKQK